MVMIFRRGPHDWDGIPSWCWPRIARELPSIKKKPFLKALRKGGRPRIDDRQAFNAILWKLRTGGTWCRLPTKFGSSSSARRRLALWMKNYRLERAWVAYLYQQSAVERQRWREGLAINDCRPLPFWRARLRNYFPY